jgi:uncharacterized membrane-anchored protein
VIWGRRRIRSAFVWTALAWRTVHARLYIHNPPLRMIIVGAVHIALRPLVAHGLPVAMPTS